MNINRLFVIKLINEFDLEIKYGEDKVFSIYINFLNVYCFFLLFIGFFDLIEEVKNIGI